MNQKYKLIWIESICDLREIIENNIFKTKINSPDYKNWEDPEKAANDFRRRIEEYEKIYESLSLDNDGLDTSFIKIINQGEKMIMRNVRGYVESKIISYLTNLHTGDRPIYFLRHGESEANKHGFIGDDYCLTENGFIFSEMLVKFFEKESEAFNEKPIIFSSTLKPNIQTAEKLSFMNDILIEKILDELNAGLREGLNLKEMAEKYPNELKERNEDKLNYRYPRGESYLDVIHRIEPVIFEMERIKSPIIVIGSQGIMRCLYGYFADFAAELIPSLEIPLHCVIKFVPEAYGFYEVRYSFDVNSQTIEKNDKNFISLLDN
jgi:broad specificity phosphatase PhoE